MRHQITLLAIEDDYLHRQSLAYNAAWSSFEKGTLHCRDFLNICEHYRTLPGVVLDMLEKTRESLSQLKETGYE